MVGEKLSAEPFKPQFVISSDCTGVFGEILQLMEVYPEAILNLPDFGVEVIGWRWVGRQITEARDQGWRPFGVHGKMGGYPRVQKPVTYLKRPIQDVLLVPHDTLLQLGEEHEDLGYVLVHVLAARSEKDQQLLTQAVGKTRVFIENSAGFRPRWMVNEAINVVRELRVKGVDAGIMFDLCHFSQALENEPLFAKRWETTMKKLQELAELARVEGFPIGIPYSCGFGEERFAAGRRDERHGDVEDAGVFVETVSGDFGGI